jgi:hypothetical protein
VTATSHQPEGLGHAGRPVDTLELRVFEGDATLRFMAARDVAPRVLLLLAPFFVFSLVAISAADGHLTTQNLPTLWCQDAGHYLFSPNWPCLNHRIQSTDFPLLRDLPSLGCAIILGVSPYLVYSQWFGIRDLYLAMFRQGLVGFRDDIPEAERLFRHEVARANDYFVRAGRRSSVAMAIAAISMLFVVASQRYGVFPSIAPSTASALTPPSPAVAWLPGMPSDGRFPTAAWLPDPGSCRAVTCEAPESLRVPHGRFFGGTTR